MIQPFIPPINGLLQRLCQLSIGWDDAIPLDLQELWMQRVQVLPKLRRFRSHDGLEFAEMTRIWSCIASVMLAASATERFVISESWEELLR